MSDGPYDFARERADAEAAADADWRDDRPSRAELADDGLRPPVAPDDAAARFPDPWAAPRDPDAPEPF